MGRELRGRRAASIAFLPNFLNSRVAAPAPPPLDCRFAAMKKIPLSSRRQFLASEAAFLGFPMIVPRSVFGAPGRPAPSERITVGRIGWGTIAGDWTPSFLNNDNFLSCIYDRRATATPIEVSHRSISIAHLANIALRTGSNSLKWSPQTETIEGNEAASKLLSKEWRKPWLL